jgi:hypothetical protein
VELRTVLEQHPGRGVSMRLDGDRKAGQGLHGARTEPGQERATQRPSRTLRER